MGLLPPENSNLLSIRVWEKMMEGEWANGSFAIERGFRPMYGMA
jgi:hypothetical protein